MQRRGMVASAAVAAVLAATTVAGGGCGGSASGSSPSGAPAGTGPAGLLRQARATIDAATSLHFVLTSTHAAGTGAVLVGGQGDAARPAGLAGTFTVTLSHLPVTVKVIATGGKVYVEAPFSRSYVATDPASFGIGDPAQLFDRTDGLSSLLPALGSLRSAGQVRIGGDVTDQIDGVLAGTALPVLPDADRSEPVAVTVDVVPSDHQVRELVLTGPFTSRATSTYTVVLDDYDEAVHIVAPAG